jgi:vacuolar-type H+-ATPase subunit I/STV1
MNTPEPVIRKVIRGGVEYEMNTSKMGRMVEYTPIPPMDEKEQKIEEMATEFQAIAEENEALKAKLAVKSMDVSEEDKRSAQELIDELRATIKSQEAQIKGLTASRDAYQQKNAELLKQVNYWKKQVPKAA